MKKIKNSPPWSFSLPWSEDRISLPPQSPSLLPPRISRPPLPGKHSSRRPSKNQSSVPSLNKFSQFILNDPQETGINLKEGVIKLTRRHLENIISFLARHDKIYIDDLSENDLIFKKLNILKAAISHLRGQEDYSLLTEIINQQYRPSIIRDGTIGAFLFGCMQQDYGDIHQSCAISCFKSFNPNPVINNCSYQLWMQKSFDSYLKGPIDLSSVNRQKSQEEISKYEKNRFILYHDGINRQDFLHNEIQQYLTLERPRMAIIYINSNFHGFYSNELETFSLNGVTMAELMIKDGSQYRRVQPLSRLDKLPRMKENSNFLSKYENPQKTEEINPEISFKFCSGDSEQKSDNYLSFDNFVPSENLNDFGQVTSPIFMEDGIYIPFMTATKGNYSKKDTNYPFPKKKSPKQNSENDSFSERFDNHFLFSPIEVENSLDLKFLVGGVFLLILVLVVIFWYLFQK